MYLRRSSAEKIRSHFLLSSCTQCCTQDAGDMHRVLHSIAEEDVTAKIVSLIDTVRYIIWPRRLVLIYIGFVRILGIIWRLQRSCKPLQIASYCRIQFCTWFFTRISMLAI